MKTVYISNLERITDTKYKIGYIHFLPFDEVNGLKKTEGELLQEGKLVALPVEQAPVSGKSIMMYYNPVTNLCFYEYEEVVVPLKTDLELKIIQIEENQLDIQMAMAELIGM